MQQHDLRGIIRPWGYAIFYGIPEGQSSSLINLDEPIALNFITQPKAPNFYNITALPLDQLTNQAAYFTNLRKKLPVYLSQHKVVQAVDFLPSYPLHFEYKFNKGEPPSIAQISVNNELNQPVTTVQIHASPQARVFRFSMPEESFGKYTIQVEGKDYASFLLTPSNQGIGFMGLTTLFIGKPEQVDNQLDEDENIQPNTYTLAFAERKTIWRYFIISNAEFPIEHLSISPKEGTDTAELKEQLSINCMILLLFQPAPKLLSLPQRLHCHYENNMKPPSC